MKKEEIMRLGSLSRIRISDAEAESLGADIDAVLAYVSVVNEITASAEHTKKVGSVYNVFREDTVTVAPGSFTEVLLAEAPQVKNNRLVVKKILNTD